MDIEIFALCDAATDYHGKLNLLGTFDAIWTKEMPLVQPQCAVALRLRFSRIEEGEHRIKINIVDEDGKLVAPSLDANTKLDFSNRPETSVAINMILNLQRLKFEKYGEYSVELAFDGRHEASLPIHIRKPPDEAIL